MPERQGQGKIIHLLCTDSSSAILTHANFASTLFLDMKNRNDILNFVLVHSYFVPPERNHHPTAKRSSVFHQHRYTRIQRPISAVP